MATTLNKKIKKLSAVRQKKIEGRAAQLIAEEMALRDLSMGRGVITCRDDKIRIIRARRSRKEEIEIYESERIRQSF